MKILITLLLLIPLNLFAQSGSSWDPIYFNIQPTQQTQNRQTTAQLKSQYGLTEFYACYPCSGQDTSNPHTETRCLIQTQYCLESNQIKKEKECPSGEIRFNGRCMIIDQACKERSGQNSYYRGVLDENGKYSCACKDGYEWDDSVTFCIKEETPNESCQKNYGINSKFRETKVDGIGICVCIDGYEWNNSKTSCIQKEAVKEPESLMKLEDVNPVKEKVNVEVKKEDKIVSDESVQDIQEKNESSSAQISEEVKKPNKSPINIIKPIKEALGKFFSKLANWFLNN